MSDDVREPQEAPEPEAKAANPPPQWEYRTSMKVTERLKNIVSLSIDVSKEEIARLRKRLDKLTYGS